jgi:hypothetical protein
MFLKLLGKHFACRGRAFATRSFLPEKGKKGAQTMAQSLTRAHALQFMKNYRLL